jgi:hypothetical protein
MADKLRSSVIRKKSEAIPPSKFRLPTSNTPVLKILKIILLKGNKFFGFGLLLTAF